jgi:hypothetical protein
MQDRDEKCLKNIDGSSTNADGIKNGSIGQNIRAAKM